MSNKLIQKHLAWPCFFLALAALVACFMASTHAPARAYFADIGFFLFIACGYTFWIWQKLVLKQDNNGDLEDLKTLMLSIIWCAGIFEIAVIVYATTSEAFEVLRADNPLCCYVAAFFLIVGLVLEIMSYVDRLRYAQTLFCLIGISIFSISTTLLMLSN